MGCCNYYHYCNHYCVDGAQREARAKFDSTGAAMYIHIYIHKTQDEEKYLPLRRVVRSLGKVSLSLLAMDVSSEIAYLQKPKREREREREGNSIGEQKNPV